MTKTAPSENPPTSTNLKLQAQILNQSSYHENPSVGCIQTCQPLPLLSIGEAVPYEDGDEPLYEDVDEEGNPIPPAGIKKQPIFGTHTQIYNLSLHPTPMNFVFSMAKSLQLQPVCLQQHPWTAGEGKLLWKK